MDGQDPNIRLDELENYIWMLFARIGATTPVNAGDVSVIRVPIALATVASAKSLPASAVVLDARLDIRTPYSPGTTITLGQGPSPALFMGAGDSDPQIAGIYQAMQDTSAVSLAPLLVTIAGAPAAGAGFALILYWVPP